VDAVWEFVFLARHGQTEWNVQRRRQGQLDSALTDNGVEQARRHAVAVEPHAVDGIFTSPLERATATAEIIAGRLGLSVTVIDELAEVHHGLFAGLTDEDISARYAREWNAAAWTNTPGHFREARAMPTPTSGRATLSPRSPTTRPVGR
jgi:broad specificity phosphatase PhoE